MVGDAWEGYSSISPTLATYRLGRSADGSFTGTVQISVGAGLIRRDTSFAIHLPRAAVGSLLQVLSEAPLREGGHRLYAHPHGRLSIHHGRSDGGRLVIRFHTRSQGEAHVPWQVSAGGKTYASGSEAIWSALGAVLDRMGGPERRELIEAGRNDPEAQCHRGGPGPRPTFAQRPRYAAGEAWFARDSSITLQGSSYRKHGLPRIVRLHEMSLYATYRGVPIFQELGLEGTPEVLYVPIHATCEVQPYMIQPRP